MKRFRVAVVAVDKHWFAYTSHLQAYWLRDACVHEVEVENGRIAKRLALREHQEKCLSPKGKVESTSEGGCRNG